MQKMFSFQEYRDQILHEGLPTQLHHYTDANGALGILQNEELWLTNARYSNDKAEIDYAINLAASVVLDYYEKSRDKLDSIDSPLHLFLESLNALLVKGKLSRDVYVSCFCENKDLLSQWRAYAGKSGFCIGFESKLLLQHAKDIYSDADVFFSRVLYDSDTWVAWIHKALIEYSVVLRDIDTSDAYNVQRDVIKLSVSFKEDVLLLAPFLKHSGFVEEQEWRLCVAYNLEQKKPEFRVGGVGLVPFLKSSTDGSVKSVVIGPTEERELAFHSLKMMSLDKGFEIHSTEVPLR